MCSLPGLEGWAGCRRHTWEQKPCHGRDNKNYRLLHFTSLCAVEISSHLIPHIIRIFPNKYQDNTSTNITWPYILWQTVLFPSSKCPFSCAEQPVCKFQATFCHAVITFYQCAQQRGVLLTCGSLWHSRCCSQRPRWKARHLDPLYTPRSGSSQDGRTCLAPGGSRRPHTHAQKKHTQDNS